MTLFCPCSYLDGLASGPKVEFYSTRTADKVIFVIKYCFNNSDFVCVRCSEGGLRPPTRKVMSSIFGAET